MNADDFRPCTKPWSLRLHLQSPARIGALSGSRLRIWGITCSSLTTHSDGARSTIKDCLVDRTARHRSSARCRCLPHGKWGGQGRLAHVAAGRQLKTPAGAPAAPWHALLAGWLALTPSLPFPVSPSSRPLAPHCPPPPPSTSSLLHRRPPPPAAPTSILPPSSLSFPCPPLDRAPLHSLFAPHSPPPSPRRQADASAALTAALIAC